MKFREFKQQIRESYVNLLPKDVEQKKQYADQIYTMIQKAYSTIGGIHGSGFNSPDDMVKNIAFWKINRKDGVIHAVSLYKNSTNGRKRVAVATDGSSEGKKALADIMRSDLTQERSYGEQSGRSLQFLINHLPNVKEFAIPVEKVKAISHGDEFRDVPHDDPELHAHPDLAKFFYQRKIGGQWHTKIAVGSPGKRIE